MFLCVKFVPCSPPSHLPMSTSVPTFQRPSVALGNNLPPAGSAAISNVAVAPTATSTMPALPNVGDIVQQRVDSTMPALPNDGDIVQQCVDVSCMNVTAPSEKSKCNCKGCPKLPSGHEMLVCNVGNCDKVVHHVCYANMIKKSAKQSLVYEDKVFCTVKHQEQFIKNTQSECLNWSNDGKNGRDDPLSSEKILIDYLNTENNYNLFRKPEGGASKLEVATRIANIINSKGVRVERTGESVKNKIDHMQRMMRETCDFVNSATREGIRAEEGFESFREKVS